MWKRRFLFHSSWHTHLGLYDLSYLWFSAASFCLTFLVGLAISLAFRRQDPKRLNPDLISPAFKDFISRWPKLVERIGLGEQYVSGDIILIMR